ncbi:WhiB family transcriptional regulator [Arcanobacterium pinnipediorum]|uniref:Transcriptional regulator WhiB n=1 Tax=Arcanobacterium pinnipediorum TaxID=1503041 RepID=A0ABY5AGI6_9ACTO|nr:WhiB family transcriptional regulator [Arcanobacterium pinnipediorum]USR79323.1 WhiB family transcriptional regulator [Arcanobacterium pinnipediorum]
MSLAYEEQTWAVHAACADVDPDSLFVRGAAQRQVRNVCFSCPVRMECLADALDSNAAFGVWGGLTERERRAILRMFPDENNWAERLKNSNEQLVVELRAGRVPRLS